MMGLRVWSREYTRCQGWADADGQHACTSPRLPHAGGGRCTRCYALHRKATGPIRDCFPSINDAVLPGEGPVATRVRETTMVNGQRDTPKIDRDVAASLGRFKVGDAAEAVAPAPALAPAQQTSAAGFEVFTLSGQTHTMEPSLTLRKDGRLSINRAAIAALGSPDAVELLYDPARRLLGLRECAPTLAHARPLLSESKGARVYVAVRALLAHHGIPHARTASRFAPAAWYGDVLAVQLATDEQAKGR